jgi:recombination protein RecA
MATAALPPQLQTSLTERLQGRFDVNFGLRQPKNAPDLLPTGIPGVDIPRGALTEIHGPASSGRTGILTGALAQATHRPEFCALIDAGDSFDPHSAAEAGVLLPHLLWVRCGGSAENALKATDLIVQAGGFGIVALDLAGVPARDARRISLASWFRLRNAIEKTPTALLVLGEELNAHSCSTLQIANRASGCRIQGNLLRGLTVDAALGPRNRAKAAFMLQPHYHE